MELRQLRCFIEAAETLHFGKAAQHMEILPAVLGRQIQTLEEEMRAALFRRSTRSVALTDAGKTLLPLARKLIAQADEMVETMRHHAKKQGRIIRIGAIDSASMGLIPALINDLHQLHPDIEVALVEGKSTRLLPKLIAGSIDLAVIRPPARNDPRVVMEPLLEERPVLAVPAHHPLATAESVAMADLAGVPMILPGRRARPHSHDLTVKLFEVAGVALSVAQEAEEKHTILRLVSAGIGAAIVQRWSAKGGHEDVVFRQLTDVEEIALLPLSAAWLRAVPDVLRDQVIDTLREKLADYRASC
ncbi:LysR family transcriptional regulator [Novosphingobium rosa]|uniref:LysR family transcriptional regulator n=1 Tax=Novosphingobium rosa TaxID=76978 RepID=UPI0008339E5B|nr:LysR family transcriptional regulator [Novosphingobium rosa]